MFYRLDLEAQVWIQDDQQGGRQLPSWSSCALYGQLHDVTDLWLVQLPSFWHDVRAQHTRHSAHRQRSRHCRRQLLGLVEPDLHCRRVNDAWCNKLGLVHCTEWTRYILVAWQRDIVPHEVETFQYIPLRLAPLFTFFSLKGGGNILEPYWPSPYQLCFVIAY